VDALRLAAAPRAFLPRQFTTIESQNSIVQWAHAAAALVVFCAFWAAHRRVQPFVHRFQNLLESWLFFSDIMIVSRAAAPMSP